MADILKHRKVHSPEYALLGFLYKQPAHGYGLHRRLINDLGHVWRVSQSQTYNILKRLGTQGYLSSSKQEQEKLPPRQLLRITPAGRRRFEEWLAVPTGSSVRAIRLEFITRLYFARSISPEKIQPMFETQAAAVNLALTRLESSLKATPAEQPFNQMSLRLRIQQLRSALDWLDECRMMFDKP